MEESVETSPRGKRKHLQRRVVKWVLLDGNRATIAGAIALLVYALLVTATVVVGPIENMRPFYYLYSALIGGNITLITVVVSINQLVLSQELHRPGELESQIEGIVDYRRAIREEAGEEPPAEPQGFLELLTDNVREQTGEVRTLVRANGEEGVSDEVETVLSPVSEHLDHVDELLERNSASTFEVLSTTLYTDYGKVIARLKRLESEEGDRLGSATCVAIDELADRLEETNVAQQYFKTIYLQQGLARLSRQLFYVGIPALVALAIGLVLLTASNDASVSHSVNVVLLSLIATIGFLPLLVLFSFLMRVATVAERTAATAPFTTPTQGGVVDVETDL